MSEIPFAKIVVILVLLGGLIAGGFLGFSFLRKSNIGKQIGIPVRRQRRLDLIERAHLDNGRKLLLVRRDDVEHLVMIGGPIDVVVETDIKRPRAPIERIRENVDPIGRYQPDWGLHREPPPSSEKATPIEPELPLSPSVKSPPAKETPGSEIKLSKEANVIS